METSRLSFTADTSFLRRNRFNYATERLLYCIFYNGESTRVSANRLHVDDILKQILANLFLIVPGDVCFENNSSIYYVHPENVV